jgi:integrase
VTPADGPPAPRCRNRQQQLSKRPSLTYVISELFKSDLAIGQSRDFTKDMMRADGLDVRQMAPVIHSWGTFRAEMKPAIAFAKWCQQRYSVKTLDGLAGHMVTEYIETRRSAGLAMNTLVSDRLALRRLESLALQAGLIPTPFVPADLRVAREFSPRGSYTYDEALSIIQWVADHNLLAAQVLRLCLSGGLRIREAITLLSGPVKDKQTGEMKLGIDPAHSRLFVEGKGGRQRDVVLLDGNVLDGLDLAIHQPLANGKEQTWIREIEELNKRACTALDIQCKGVHAYRATAANLYRAQRVAAGASARQAKQEVSRWLGHNRPGVVRHYLDV